jgi:hypothetical protein
MPTQVGLHSYSVGSRGLGYVSTAVVLNLLLVVAPWGLRTQARPLTAGVLAACQPDSYCPTGKLSRREKCFFPGGAGKLCDI